MSSVVTTLGSAATAGASVLGAWSKRGGEGEVSGETGAGAVEGGFSGDPGEGRPGAPRGGPRASHPRLAIAHERTSELIASIRGRARALSLSLKKRRTTRPRVQK